MNILNHFGKVRKGCRVWYYSPIRISALCPAVIHIDVLVPDLDKLQGNKSICDFLYDRLVDIAAEVVPRIPAHLRSSPQPIVKSRDS